MSSVELTPVPSPFSEALIVVCEKCGKKLVPEGADNPSKQLQLALKERIFQSGKKGVLRAVVTSCLDVCPNGAIAVGIFREKDGSGTRRFFTFRGPWAAAVETILKRVSE